MMIFTLKYEGASNGSLTLWGWQTYQHIKFGLSSCFSFFFFAMIQCRNVVQTFPTSVGSVVLMVSYCKTICYKALKQKGWDFHHALMRKNQVQSEHCIYSHSTVIQSSKSLDSVYTWVIYLSWVLGVNTPKMHLKQIQLCEFANFETTIFSIFLCWAKQINNWFPCNKQMCVFHPIQIIVRWLNGDASVY